MIKEEAVEILSDMRAEYNIFSDDEEEATRYHALSWAIRALNERTGRWIEDSGNIACSECHIIWLHRRTAFCPNCGARMEEGE